MIIKNETQNYITIESDKKDAEFLFQALSLGIQSIQVPKEDRLRFINFIKDLGERLNLT